MSGHSKEQAVSYEYPVPTKIPGVVKNASVFGLLVLFLILGIVTMTAPEGHVWPAEESVKVPLSASK